MQNIPGSLLTSRYYKEATFAKSCFFSTTVNSSRMLKDLSETAPWFCCNTLWKLMANPIQLMSAVMSYDIIIRFTYFHVIHIDPNNPRCNVVGRCWEPHLISTTCTGLNQHSPHLYIYIQRTRLSKCVNISPYPMGILTASAPHLLLHHLLAYKSYNPLAHSHMLFASFRNKGYPNE